MSVFLIAFGAIQSCVFKMRHMTSEVQPVSKNPSGHISSLLAACPLLLSEQEGSGQSIAFTVLPDKTLSLIQMDLSFSIRKYGTIYIIFPLIPV